MMNFNYHPGKANFMADALRRKSYGSLTTITIQDTLIEEFQKLGLVFCSFEMLSAMVYDFLFIVFNF